MAGPAIFFGGDTSPAFCRLPSERLEGEEFRSGTGRGRGKRAWQFNERAG